MRYRFSVLSVWHELKGDIEGMMTAFHETISFYENSEVELPSAFLSFLYFKLTPHLVADKMYAAAEAHLSKGIMTVKEGNVNWHLLMLQKVCLGLVSGKKGMAQSCLKKASLAPKEHNNPEIDERWAVVERLLNEGASDFEEVWGAVF